MHKRPLRVLAVWTIIRTARAPRLIREELCMPMEKCAKIASSILLLRAGDPLPRCHTTRAKRGVLHHDEGSASLPIADVLTLA